MLQGLSRTIHQIPQQKCLHPSIFKFGVKNSFSSLKIAISGKSFCFAAKDAFFLILRNPAKFGIVAGIGELFIFIGKIFIAALGTISAFAIIAYCEPWKSKLSSPVLPTIVNKAKNIIYLFCILFNFILNK